MNELPYYLKAQADAAIKAIRSFAGSQHPSRIRLRWYDTFDVLAIDTFVVEGTIRHPEGLIMQIEIRCVVTRDFDTEVELIYLV